MDDDIPEFCNVLRVDRGDEVIPFVSGEFVAEVGSSLEERVWIAAAMMSLMTWVGVVVWCGRIAFLLLFNSSLRHFLTASPSSHFPLSGETIWSA